ncbi:hypothetical protein ABMA27_002544 [Loxostege sticticalis]|uniref:Retrovirus-related Pol polyprotein from transposon TNT 1-94 n=1 Tax=Loxostege sticticalis TaxID=481309 RepID=A0ABR3HU12_LOXSC
MSSSNNSLALIEKLTGRDNYATWRFAVKTFLEHEELWDCVEPSDPSQEIDKKRDTKARSKIILLVDPVNYFHIQESSTSKEVWNNLSRAFDDSGLTRRVGLLLDLCNTTLAECSNVEEYVSKIMTTAHKLRNIGFHVDDEWLGTLLLSGLPESYKPMIIAIESSGMKISSDSIKSKILQDVKQNESDLTAFASSQKFHNKNKSFSKGPRCYTCNKYGHKRKYQKNKESKQNQSSYAAVFIASSGYSDDWYIDSGASVHMTKHKNLFIEETTPDIKTIKVANNKSLPVQSSGKISLCVDNERAQYFVTFLDDYSKKIFVYILHNKSEVLEKFIEFKKLVENQLSRTIKVLRTDNGTLIERAKCMMLNAKLPKVYWAEAIHTAAYIINRSPTKCYKTPEEMWTGQKPNVSHMRTFGYEAMVHLPKEKRKKLDSKSQKLIFIGYCENTKGYRFLLPNSRKAIKSRDAIFLESTVKRDYVPIELTTNECSIQNKDCEELSSDDSFNTVTENKSQSDSEYFPDESIESSPERNITVRTRRQYKLASQEQEESSYLCFDEQLNN